MTEDGTRNEDDDATDDRIEEVEHSDRRYADHKEKGAFDTHIGKGLMQAFEDSVAALLSCFRHKAPRVKQSVEWEWGWIAAYDDVGL